MDVKQLHQVNDMLPTYSAILRAGVLEWRGHAPPDDPVHVQVTILAPLESATASGPAMASALAAFADAGGPSGFDDPAQWQRDSRRSTDTSELRM